MIERGMTVALAEAMKLASAQLQEMPVIDGRVILSAGYVQKLANALNTTAEFFDDLASHWRED